MYCGRTGETWKLFICCKGAPPEKEKLLFDIDRADISFVNLLALKSKLGYSSRDFLYYMNRCGRDVATLEAIDYADDVDLMIQNNEVERKIRLILCTDEPTEQWVSITPLKRLREPPTSDLPCSREPIDAYKDWLENLRDKQPDIEFHDDYREETITTYTEWLKQQRKLYDIMSYLKPAEDAVHTHSDGENDESSSSPREFPSHARHPKKKGNELDFELIINALIGGGKKNGRGTLNGLSAAIKRIKSGSQKLQIEFSERLDGPIGPNERAFVDEVASFTRKRAPLIGVKSWRHIKENVKKSIVSDIMHKWEFVNTADPKEKILQIASERYRGWRSTFSATYKAYNSYAARMRKKPDDLNIVEWHYLILYFGTEKFKVLRDPETGGEPDDLTLFKITHTKNDKWSNTASQNVYDNAQLKILERETEADRLLTPEEENIEFQAAYKETTGSKSSRPHGHGYMAKYPTRREMMNAKLQEQARDAAAAKEKNIELEGRVKQLQEQLENEATERDRLLEEHKRQIQEQAEKERNEFKEEMLSLMAKQREELLQQTNQVMNIPHEVAETPTQVHKTRVSNVNRNIFENNNAIATQKFISSHDLRSAAKGRLRTRNDKDDAA
ncbi:hypothetical protein EJB05_01645, partial [Eragrostis curvula]